MGLNIDLRSAVFFNALIALGITCYFLYFYRTHRTHPGFIYWICSSLCYFLHESLVGLRGVVPDWASIVFGGNLFNVLGYIFISIGFARFLDRRTYWKAGALAAAAMGLAAIYFTYVTPSLGYRIILQCVLSLPLILYSLYLCGQAAQAFSWTSILWLFLSLIALAVALVARAIFTALTDVHRSTDFFQSSVFQSYFSLILPVLLVSIYMGLLAVHALRNEIELKAALGEVTKLQGLLPICACCKKIRDEKGGWSQIERYISERSAATFSHGYCPECAEKALAQLR